MKLRKNSRKDSVCHPDIPNHAHGLCFSCYKKERRKKGGPSVDRERAASREIHKKWKSDNPEKARLIHAAAGARWRVRNSEHLYHYHLKRKYGLSSSRVQVMKLAQRNRCAICRHAFKGTPNVDHDHSTGQVRGLLCTRCNHLLGVAGDSCARLRQAIAYLKEWE